MAFRVFVAPSRCLLLLLSGLLFVLICDIDRVRAASVYKSPNLDDARYWNKYAESYIKQVLTYDENRRMIPSVAKNVIIFVGDGMGIASLSTGRIFKGQRAGRSGEEEQLSFDMFPNTGMSKTYNTDRQVPDSAGTATAMFSGVKTKYGVLGVDYTINESNLEAAKVSSFIEWAQQEGKRTGIVTTTRITHATPAACYAHTINRNYECDAKVPALMKTRVKDIARQLIEDAPGKDFNVILGGGRNCFGASVPTHLKTEYRFQGAMEKTCTRTDGRNLIDEWLQRWNGTNAAYAWKTSDLRAIDLDSVEHLLGLFADDHMSYDTVRDRSDDGEPSLSEMTEAAIKVLQRRGANGFALMVEGGRIDHAHHQNHAHLALAEVVELDKAVETALKMVDLDETLIIVTADHSHAMTFNGYPDRGNDILGFGNRPNATPYETITYANGPGFLQHRWNDTMLESTADWATWVKVDQLNRTDIKYRHLSAFPLGDETHGGEDVAVFAAGPGSNLVRGTFEQSYIAHVMSYATCTGPSKKLNLACDDDFRRNGLKASGAARSHTVSSIALVTATLVATVRKLF
ncbi:alkaline phosphatase 4 [Anopheles ziemanni]|uniref:alkaline phosphatase 4 n=1 Tax=Anopheles coustani TaxID=139045 RepID=UPI00265B2F24|nr:alkaline phosphatase 4 [Anopheles coustani]XP_058170933.1 alkaline phosphatase 4 [Anopheles ziemanni]